MAVKPHKTWFSFYKAALLEPDVHKIPERIVKANNAIQERLRNLEQASGHYQEKLEIQYAVRNLHVVMRMS